MSVGRPCGGAAFLYRAVKAADPNHLSLGFWISIGWWVNDEDRRLISPEHCASRVSPPCAASSPSRPLTAVRAALVGEAARNPACVGVCWFQYRDEPMTGRRPGLVYGEHYAFGLVDVTDAPQWDLVTPVRAENLAAMRGTKTPQSVSRGL